MVDKELVIIGGGPGGYVPAIKAAQMGINVTLVEKDELGGTCLNRGCIPTKALLKAALLYEETKTMSSFGVTVEGSKFHLAEAIKWKERVVKRLSGGVRALLNKNNVEVIKGKAVFKGSNTLIVGEKEMTFKNAIIASGSVAATLPIPGIQAEHVIYSDDALNLSKIPERLVIIGGGVIGVEFASIFNAAGSQVTIIEMMPEILPVMDKDLSKGLKTVLKKKKIDIFTNSRVTEVKKDVVVMEHNGEKQEIKCDTVLVAVGRKPNIEDLGLENAGIEFDKKGIKVNEYMETNVAGIYAVGDVVPTPQLAHVASEEGIVAVYNIAGERRKMKYNAVPYCVYTNPEAASVGMTEEEAREKGISYKIGMFPLMVNGKAMVEGVRDGFVKIIAGKEYEEVLGVHIMAPHASEMIHQACTALTLEATLDELIETIYPHPTMGEAILEAALSAKGKAIHI